MRMTAKAPTEGEARALLDAEDAELRKVLGELVFAVDDDTMESEVLRLCGARLDARRRRVAHRRAFIGAPLGQRSRCQRDVPRLGRRVRHRREARDVLGVTAEDVVSEEAAKQMAEGAQRDAGARRRISVTGVAGPTRGRPAGRHRLVRDRDPRATSRGGAAQLPFDRDRVRQFSAISALNLLRMRLLALP